MSFQSKFVEMLLAEVDAAILKVAGVPAPAGSGEEFSSAEEARDAFREGLRVELIERLGGVATVTVPVAVAAPVVAAPVVAAVAAPVAASPGEKKKRGPMSDEKKAAMKAKRDATIAAKKADSSPAAPVAVVAEVPVAEASPASTADSPKEKKKRAPMTDEAKAAMKAKRDATLAAKASAVNLLKIDPTWRKHLKTAAKAQKAEVTKDMETALLAYLNAMSKETFHSQKAEEHVVAFLVAPTGTNAAGGAAPAAAAPALAPAAVEKQPTDLVVIEFNGEEYYVNEESKRVYIGEGEQDPETGAWTSYKAVGYVGMAAFAEMPLDEE